MVYRANRFLIYFDSLPFKRKDIYYINTVLDLELVNNLKQSPLSQVGVYTTFFVYVSDFRNNSVAVDFRMRAMWDM